jgi:raffinose/stachyose/melibiose transport system substrate-binding protein
MDNLRAKIPEDIRADGQEWAVPFGAISLAVVYNVEIFDELGLEAPETWDEFMENNAALREAGYAPLSLTGELWKSWWPRILLDQTSRDVAIEDITSGEVSFTDPRILEALQIMQDMYAAGVFPDGGLNQGVEESQALFASGQMAQFLTVPENFVQYLVENSPFETAAYVLPGAKGVEPVRTLGGSGSFVSVNKDAENMDAALAVAKYLSSETLFSDVLADHFVVAPTEGWSPDSAAGEIMSVYGEAAAGGYIPPKIVPASQLSPEAAAQIENELLPAVYTGELSPEDFMLEVEGIYEAEGE